MSAVLEAPAPTLGGDVAPPSGGPGRGAISEAHDRGSDRLLVDCSICGSTHTPGTETDPRCPGLSLDGSPCNDVTAG